MCLANQLKANGQSDQDPDGGLNKLICQLMEMMTLRDEASRRYFRKVRNLSQFSNKISYVNSVVLLLVLGHIFGKSECGMITQFWNVADAVISNTDAVNNFERRPHFRIFGSITLILVIFGIQECH